MDTFIKDIILFVLIVIVFVGARYITPALKGVTSFVVIFTSALLVLFFQWYVLKHLPVIDCLPFKKGNNILELRKMPANAIPDKLDFKFVYEKNGEKKEFDQNSLPDSTWAFVNREDFIVEKGKNNEPPIKDFFITTLAGTDTTESILSQQGYYYLFFIKDFNKSTDKWLADFSRIDAFAKEKKRPLIVVASQATVAQQFFNLANNFNVRVFSCDVTALKTAARTDPSIYLMNGPVVERKWGLADFNKIMK